MSLNDELKHKPSISIPRANFLQRVLSQTRTRNRFQKLRELRTIITRLAEKRGSAERAFNKHAAKPGQGKKQIKPKQAPKTEPKLVKNNYRTVGQPVSKMQIDDLHKQLSEPTPENTPMGEKMRTLAAQRDQSILNKIAEQRSRLASRNSTAKEAMDRASPKPKPAHKPKF